MSHTRRRTWPRQRAGWASVGERAPIRTCPCGKFGYASRKDAKRTMKTMPPDPAAPGHLDAYRCTLTDSGLWHIGHLPTAVVQGTIGRAQIIATPRDPGPRRTPPRRNNGGQPR